MQLGQLLWDIVWVHGTTDAEDEECIAIEVAAIWNNVLEL